jgi:hypothetical protein
MAATISSGVDEVGLLTQLVEDLRTLALAEAGTLALHTEPTDIAILAHDSVAAFSGLAEETDVKVEVEAMDDMPLVDLDPLRIRQVLVNLIANALHYAPRGSVVRVIGRREGGFVAISVSDEGRGIAPEVLPHLFERFAKSDDSRGSGLGLAIARRLVETGRSAPKSAPSRQECRAAPSSVSNCRSTGEHNERRSAGSGAPLARRMTSPPDQPGSWPRVSVIVVVVPLEVWTWTCVLSPGWSLDTTESRVALSGVDWPPTERITSPATMPAAAAGPPAVTCATRTPWALSVIETPR